MPNRTPEEAIQTIRKNWPDERYTMLREALEYAITAIEEHAKLVKALYHLEKEQVQDEKENATLKKRLKAIVMAIQDYDDVQYPSASGLIEWLESVTPYEDIVREMEERE